MKRLVELDLVRGVAIVAMIGYHFYFSMIFWGGLPAGNVFSLVARMIQVVPFVFLLILGIGVHIRFERYDRTRYWKSISKQVLIVAAASMLVTIATAIVAPGMMVWFGILQCCAVSIGVVSLIVARRWHNVVMLVAVLWIMAIGWVFAREHVQLWLLLPLGLQPVGFRTLDYFPIFPWVGAALLGSVLGRVLYPDGEVRAAWKCNILQIRERFQVAPGRWLVWLGQHSLLLYMVHIPIIWLVLTLYVQL